MTQPIGQSLEKSSDEPEGFGNDDPKDGDDANNADFIKDTEVEIAFSEFAAFGADDHGAGHHVMDHQQAYETEFNPDPWGKGPPRDTEPNASDQSDDHEAGRETVKAAGEVPEGAEFLRLFPLALPIDQGAGDSEDRGHPSHDAQKVYDLDPIHEGVVA